MRAPKECPMCHELEKWQKVIEDNKPHSSIKPNEGILSNLSEGLFCSVFKQTKVKFFCGNCGFSYYYEIY